ncbi:hypothetical protein QJS10_CPA08g01873 [Acorus calamus]|uniref:Oleosin n=1 Tax=Acorus calamus TaxID=4465 RepID=A0AAV9ECH6_ACOCL|nr:hypothetical protein QJS10_CPA08g01873 [Acorus calamus]
MEPHKTDGPGHPRKQTGLTRSTVLYASAAGFAVSAPLLGMTALTLLATMTLLLITPLILSAGFVFAASMVGFASAAAMAFCGVYALGWVVRCARGEGLEGGFEERRVVEMVTEPGQKPVRVA